MCGDLSSASRVFAGGLPCAIRSSKPVGSPAGRVGVVTISDLMFCLNLGHLLGDVPPAGAAFHPERHRAADRKFELGEPARQVLPGRSRRTGGVRTFRSAGVPLMLTIIACAFAVHR